MTLSTFKDFCYSQDEAHLRHLKCDPTTILTARDTVLLMLKLLLCSLFDLTFISLQKSHRTRSCSAPFLRIIYFFCVVSEASQCVYFTVE